MLRKMAEQMRELKSDSRLLIQHKVRPCSCCRGGRPVSRPSSLPDFCPSPASTAPAGSTLRLAPPSMGPPTNARLARCVIACSQVDLDLTAQRFLQSGAQGSASLVSLRSGRKVVLKESLDSAGQVIAPLRCQALAPRVLTAVGEVLHSHGCLGVVQTRRRPPQPHAVIVDCRL